MGLMPTKDLISLVVVSLVVNKSLNKIRSLKVHLKSKLSKTDRVIHSQHLKIRGKLLK